MKINFARNVSLTGPQRAEPNVIIKAVTNTHISRSILTPKNLAESIRDTIDKDIRNKRSTKRPEAIFFIFCVTKSLQHNNKSTSKHLIYENHLSMLKRILYIVLTYRYQTN